MAEHVLTMTWQFYGIAAVLALNIWIVWPGLQLLSRRERRAAARLHPTR